MFKKSNSNIERTLKVQEFYTKTQVLYKKLRLNPLSKRPLSTDTPLLFIQLTIQITYVVIILVRERPFKKER
jgi:hypothetical protein